MRLVIISGQSGAGKSIALHALEDLGYYGIDNLPVRLLPALVREVGEDRTPPIARVAAVVDVRSPHHELHEFDTILARVEAMGVEAEVLFLEAEREILLKRFSETRRRHPLTEGRTTLFEALEREAAMLDPVRRRAEVTVDTSRTNLHQLRTLVQERVGREDTARLSLLLQSFGFKHGAPRDADMVLDVRCLPNPYWEPDLKGLSGRDPAVAAFLERSPLVERMFQDLAGFLAAWLPCFERENRAYFSVAIGCTGGRHRSVHMVERLAAHLAGDYPGLIVRHRDLDD